MTRLSQQVHADRAAKAARSSRTPDAGIASSFWGWINSVADGVTSVIAGPFAALSKSTRLALAQVASNEAGWYRALLRLSTWWERGYWHWLQGKIHQYRAQQQASQIRLYARLDRLVHALTQSVLAYALAAVRAERRARLAEVARAEHQARLQIRHLHQVIEREAASGYQLQQPARLTLIRHLLDLIVTRDPLLRDVVGHLAQGVLTLAEVDDPVLRWTVGLLLREVIDRLGVNHLIGDLLQQLLAPIIGQPVPRDLHDVVADISARLGAVEGQWATFMDHGGPQVEQAGSDWADISSAIGDAAVVAFAAGAVLDPEGWAAALSDSVGVALNAAGTAIADLLGKV